MYGRQANRAGNLRNRKIKFAIFAELGYVVQLDRISDFDSEGWRFESFRGHTLKCFSIKWKALFLSPQFPYQHSQVAQYALILGIESIDLNYPFGQSRVRFFYDKNGYFRIWKRS